MRHYFTFTRDGERYGIDASEMPAEPVIACPLEGDPAAMLAAFAADPDFEGATDWAAEPAEPADLAPEVLAGPSVTVPQYLAAVQLAARHGHAWGYACLTPSPVGEAHRAARRVIYDRCVAHHDQTAYERADDGPVMIPIALITHAALAAETGQRWGIYEPSLSEAEVPGTSEYKRRWHPEETRERVVTHSTQTGRATWAVRPNGDTQIKIWRPHPLVGPIRRALESSGHWCPDTAPAFEPLAADVAEALAAARPAAELVEGSALDDRDVLRWLLAALEAREPAVVLEADCRADGRCWVSAPEGAPPFAVRHLLALEECLEALRAWPAGGNEEMRALFERCPDWREFVEGVREAFDENLRAYGYDYACRKWHWLAGPVPAQKAA